MRMKAALWYGPEEVRVEETEIPEVGRGEVLVKIGVALTCGTDFKLFRRGHALLVKKTPAPFGHEMAGTIAALGEGVSNFCLGERVVAANSAPCGDCFFCFRQQPNLCENLEFLNGAYAEYIRVPARIVSKNLYPIPNHVTFRDAALTEPLSCALRCIEEYPVTSRDTVLVIGAGPCGLLFVQLAKKTGAKVICIGRNLTKLEAAKNLGADHALSVLLSANIEEEVRRLANNGYGPDLVIEAAGQQETWELACSLVRKGGRVSFYGGCSQGTKISLDTHRAHYEELSLHGVFHHTPDHFRRALTLISEGKIDVEHLIEGERKLSEINQIFRKKVAENPLKFAILP